MLGRKPVVVFSTCRCAHSSATPELLLSNVGIAKLFSVPILLSRSDRPDRCGSFQSSLRSLENIINFAPWPVCRDVELRGCTSVGRMLNGAVMSFFSIKALPPL